MANQNVLKAVAAGYLLALICGMSEASYNLIIDRIENVVENLEILGYVALVEGIAAAAGAVLFAILAELIGRKYSLLALSVPMIAGYLMSEIFYYNTILLCIARACGGLSIGGTFAVLPNYIGEISEARSRGTLISAMYTCYTIGVLFVTQILILIHNGSYVVTIVGIILCILFIIAFGLLAPETPFYYLKKRRYNVAKIILDKLRYRSINTEVELEDMKGMVNKNEPNDNTSEKVMTCLPAPGWLKGTIMVAGVILSQLVMTVGSSQIIVLTGGLPSDVVRYVYGVALLIGVFICPFLVDKIGRKPLLILSYAGFAVAQIIFTIMLTIIGLFTKVPSIISLPIIIFVVSSSITLPIRLILIAELFPLRVKMLLSGIMTASFFGLRLPVVLISFHIPIYLLNILGIFINICMALIVRIFYLETKGKSLQEIQIILNQQ